VPPENFDRREGQGFRYILDGMNASASWSPRNASAMAAGCCRRASDYAKERIVFDRRSAEPGRPIPLARAYAELEAAT